MPPRPAPIVDAIEPKKRRRVRLSRYSSSPSAGVAEMEREEGIEE
jgi:hypothetical protein